MTLLAWRREMKIEELYELLRCDEFTYQAMKMISLNDFKAIMTTLEGMHILNLQ